ncbi:hypothetical protein STEG23_005033 [Scotinomys teguina]
MKSSKEKPKVLVEPCMMSLQVNDETDLFHIFSESIREKIYYSKLEIYILRQLQTGSLIQGLKQTFPANLPSSNSLPYPNSNRNSLRTHSPLCTSHPVDPHSYSQFLILENTFYLEHIVTTSVKIPPIISKQAKMGRRQGKSAYNIIKNKTTPESSPPPTPKSDFCNVDKAEENDLKKSLMKMLEEAFEEKMKNVSKEIGENTNKKLEEINKEIEEKKSKKLEEMNNEIEEKKNKKLEEMNNEIEEKKNKRVEEMNKEIEEKRNKNYRNWIKKLRKR